MYANDSVQLRLFHLIKTECMSINKEWHLANPMPKNATIEQRIKWHAEHLKHCSCRTGLPDRIKEEIKKHHIKVN